MTRGTNAKTGKRVVPGRFSALMTNYLAQLSCQLMCSLCEVRLGCGVAEQEMEEGGVVLLRGVHSGQDEKVDGWCWVQARTGGRQCGDRARI